MESNLSDPASFTEDPRKVSYTHRDLKDTKSTNLHLASNSVLYTKLLPIVLAVLGVITILLIIVAAGIVVGFVPFR